MTAKSGALYQKVFEKIKELSVNLEPTEWMTDFETGLQNALQENWPESKINGCGFHFKNATGKWIRKNALFYDYRTNTVVKAWIQKVQFLFFSSNFFIDRIFLLECKVIIGYNRLNCLL